MGKETTKGNQREKKRAKPYNKGTGGGKPESISAEDTLLGPHLTLAQEQQGFLP
jgi:hypothetical protein